MQHHIKGRGGVLRLSLLALTDSPPSRECVGAEWRKLRVVELFQMGEEGRAVHAKEHRGRHIGEMHRLLGILGRKSAGEIQNIASRYFIFVSLSSLLSRSLFLRIYLPSEFL